MVVTSKNLSRGDHLTKFDVRIEQRDLATVHQGYFTILEDVIGQVSGRTLRSGTIITPAQIKPAVLVKRGDPVTIKAGSKSFVARMKGKAMADGSAGQIIDIKNLGSKRVIQAKVMAPGLVEVQL